MQQHWIAWGPPVYLPVAGYFGLGGGKKGKTSSPAQLDGDLGLRGGDLNELVNFFNGGLIN